MRVLILTGMSGAGKSKTLKLLEDNGYYCLDNLPIKLLSEFVGMLLKLEEFPQQLAVTADVRNHDISEELTKEIDMLRRDCDVRVLFMDSEDSILLKRYKETRRLHPLMMFDTKLDLQKAIKEERHLLESVRAYSDFVIDTSYLSTTELREKLLEAVGNDKQGRMSISFVAFGYKYGIPADADIVFDVRCLPNPFYIPELKNLTGNDRAVRDYVMGCPESQMLYKRITDYLECALPMYEKEGKAQLVCGLGCTGGQHRSLTFALLLAEYFADKGYRTYGGSRDMSRNLTEIKQRDKQ